MPAAGLASQRNPSSIRQLPEQPSPLIVFLSSHSASPLIPSPQTSTQMAPASLKPCTARQATQDGPLKRKLRLHTWQLVELQSRHPEEQARQPSVELSK